MHIDNGENWDPKKAEEEFKKRIIETISELKHCPFCGLQPEFKKINVNMGHENYDGFEISCYGREYKECLFLSHLIYPV